MMISKTVLNTTWRLRLCAILFLIMSAPCHGEQTDGIHFHSGFKFRDSPADMRFITAFSLGEFLQDPRVMPSEEKGLGLGYRVFRFLEGNKTLKVNMCWWIFTSVFDAEEKLLEQFPRYQIGFINAIDIGKSGEIGDNCWYAYRYKGENLFEVWFIRNNVLVNVGSPFEYYPDQQLFEDFIKLVDRLLIETDKVASASDIPVPVITGAEVVTEGLHREGRMTVKVHATDPRGQVLVYTFLGDAKMSSGSPNGIVTMPTPENGSIIWVINEDRIVSVLRKDFLPVSVNDSEGNLTEVPQIFTLSQNAPNPFNPSTVIGFELSSPQSVRLAVYSASGQKVRKLAVGHMSSGRRSVTWDGRDDAGGVYLYRLEAGGRSEARKILLLR